MEKKDITGILTSSLSAYKMMMVKYTKDTGGGDGDSVACAVWQNRDEIGTVTYAPRAKLNVYLTIVHIWDKQYSFPLVVAKGDVPEGMGVDDICYDATDGASSLATAGDSRHLSPPPRHHSKDGGRAIADALSASSRMRSNDMRAMSDVADKMIAAVTKMSSNPNESFDSMSNTEKQIQLQKAIEHTSSQIQNFEGQLKDLSTEKRKIPRMAKSSTKKNRREKL